MSRTRHVTTALKVLVGAAAVVATTLGPVTNAGAVTKISHSSATSQLSSAGITWSSSGNCSDRNNSTCTSFEQINQETISGIRTYRGVSGCAVNVTGGTEVGHASGTYSHYNGYKVDISVSTCNTNYITSHYTYIGGSKYQSASGNIYYHEGNHWDITYYSCGC